MQNDVIFILIIMFLVLIVTTICGCFLMLMGIGVLVGFPVYYNYSNLIMIEKLHHYIGMQREHQQIVSIFPNYQDYKLTEQYILLENNKINIPSSMQFDMMQYNLLVYMNKHFIQFYFIPRTLNYCVKEMKGKVLYLDNILYSDLKVLSYELQHYNTQLPQQISINDKNDMTIRIRMQNNV